MRNFAETFDGSMDMMKASIKTFLEPFKAFLNAVSGFWVGAALITVIFAVLLIFNIVHNKDGIKEMKRPKNLAVCAMLIALNVILGYFSITFSSYLRVGFGFITAPAAAYIFGPIAGGIVALLSDAASFVLKPTGGFLFTYTLNTAVAGMIYGMLLYGRELTFKRVFLCKLTVIAAVNIILNSIALAPTAGSGMVGILPARIIKNIILLPIQSVVVYEVLKIISNISKGRK